MRTKMKKYRKRKKVTIRTASTIQTGTILEGEVTKEKLLEFVKLAEEKNAKYFSIKEQSILGGETYGGLFFENTEEPKLHFTIWDMIRVFINDGFDDNLCRTVDPDSKVFAAKFGNGIDMLSW